MLKFLRAIYYLYANIYFMDEGRDFFLYFKICKIYTHEYYHQKVILRIILENIFKYAMFKFGNKSRHIYILTLFN